MSPAQNDFHGFQLIDGKGEFNDEGLHKFITDTNLSKCGFDYAVVAIIGPQSSGKSTFMNHFGGTSFKEMNSQAGRNQTTHGIWISNCVAIQQPFTIAMDIEGTDGEERGEDDTAFEGQSALFGLAVADTLIVNLWCHDIGRQKAASNTLLQTVLQIRMRMLMDNSHKANLCFVLRDKTTTPLEILEEKIKSNMEKIWTTIARSNGFERTNITDFFNVIVFGLANYETHRKEFEDQVAELRERILKLDRVAVVPAVAFQENAHQLWKTIKEEPYLNLPAQHELIAEHMCNKMANTWLNSLASSKDLIQLKKEVAAGHVSGFGDKLHSLMEATLSKYRREVQHFEERKVSEREEVLRSQILEILYPLYVTMLGHARNKAFQEFKKMLTKLQKGGVAFVGAYKPSYNTCKVMFEDQCRDVVKKLSAGSWLNLRYNTEVGELQKDMENHVSSIRSDSIAKLEKKYQYAVSGYITTSLDRPPQDLTGDTYWEWIGEIIRMSTSKDNAGPLSNLSSEVATYSQDITLSGMMIQNLKTYARKEVVRKLKAEDNKKVVERMINRFSSVLSSIGSLDSTTKKEVRAAAYLACAEAMKLLSVMAVVQIGNNRKVLSGLLFASLMDEYSDENSSTSVKAGLLDIDGDRYEGVSKDDTILAPRKCKSLRDQFAEPANEILKDIVSDVSNIRWENRKEVGIRFTRRVSTGVGMLVTPLAGMVGAVLAGDVTGLLGSVPVGAVFQSMTHYLRKNEGEARERITEGKERYLQHLQNLKQGGQSSCNDAEDEADAEVADADDDDDANDEADVEVADDADDDDANDDDGEDEADVEVADDDADAGEDDADVDADDDDAEDADE